ncbi:MAG: YggS family pyridoxal phosphate-dependent enzyme [Deltaproteobacteria bacterium]|nr:YggS family pyridoxal phosphate-dependent enzyme [Deltaproteobacteria bacterium]
MTPARLEAVRARIAAACAAAGRGPEAVTLVAVSKTFPAEAVRAAYALGLRDFGENYAQELRLKAEALRDLALRWHFVGHLQRNKVGPVAAWASVVHAVDSVPIAAALGRRVAQAGRSVRVLVQVDLTGAEGRSGCAPEALPAVLDAVRAEGSLTLSGLMTLPPHTEDPRGARAFFDALAALRERHGGPSALPELSMGMTHDLEVAIEAGATMVRVGTGLFGHRG